MTTPKRIVLMHNNTPPHDKVWGVVLYAANASPSGRNTYTVFWGRRGNKMMEKYLPCFESQLKATIAKKKRTGYKVHYIDPSYK